MDPILYHTHHTLHSEDFAFWRDIAEETPGPVLELGCGTGRVLLRLLREEIRVVGIDNDPEMLDFLRRMIPPTLGQQVEIFETDMRTFELGKKFPLIILPCNTLSTFTGEDRLKIFERVQHHLQPGGRFIFSMPNTLVLQDLAEVGEIELEDEFTHPGTGYPIEVYSSWQRSPGQITFFWRYDHVIPEAEIIHTEHSTTHLLDSPQTYLKELQQCGLKPSAAYGDFFQDAFSPQSSYFILVVSLA